MVVARTLPDYRNPPVVEVAISVFFKPLLGFKTAHFGGFWELHKRDYPTADDQPPIFETAPPQLLELPPFRRVFLLSTQGTFVMQLQPDFFAHNWRRIPESEPYPHFERLRPAFLEKWQSFRAYVEETKLGKLEPTRYEVTYVNQFTEPKGAFPMALERYSHLITLRSREPDHFLPDPSALSAELQFKIPDDKGTLRVSFKHGARAADGPDTMQVDLTARTNARPDGSDMEQWLEVAHTWIVNGFTDLTSREAHRLWERTL